MHPGCREEGERVVWDEGQAMEAICTAHSLEHASGGKSPGGQEVEGKVHPGQI